MGVNIQVKPDMSFLFSSLGSAAAGTAGSNFLSDYAAIKNGSYLRLMKAYYGDSKSSSVNAAAKEKADRYKTSTLTSEEAKAYKAVQSASDTLKESADALLAVGSGSVFEKKEVTRKDANGMETTSREYDADAIYKAVSGFVAGYNAVVTAAGKADDGGVARRTASLVNDTTANLKSLLSLGITVNADATLSLDKATFMGADMNRAKSLFQGNGSYAYRVSGQASLINYAADNALNKSRMYTTSGAYAANDRKGNLYSSWL